MLGLEISDRNYRKTLILNLSDWNSGKTLILEISDWNSGKTLILEIVNDEVQVVYYCLRKTLHLLIGGKKIRNHDGL